MTTSTIEQKPEQQVSPICFSEESQQDINEICKYWDLMVQMNYSDEQIGTVMKSVGAKRGFHIELETRDNVLYLVFARIQ